MLRKVFIILLTLNFLVLSVGIAQNFHLCKNQVKEVSFFVPFEDVSKCCGTTEMPEGCCKSESSFIQLEDDYHQESSSVKVPDLPILEYLQAFIHVLNSYVKEHSQVYTGYTPPLTIEKQPTYLINQIFLI